MVSSSSLMVQDFDHQQYQYHLSCLRQHFEELWKRLEQLHAWQDLQDNFVQPGGKGGRCVCVGVLYVHIHKYINISILNYKRIISCLAGGFSPIESSPNTNEHQKILKPQPRYVYPYPVHHDICLENVAIIIACPSQNHGSGEHDPAKENERNSELFRWHKSK